MSSGTPRSSPTSGGTVWRQRASGCVPAAAHRASCRGDQALPPLAPACVAVHAAEQIHQTEPSHCLASCSATGSPSSVSCRVGFWCCGAGVEPVVRRGAGGSAGRHHHGARPGASRRGGRLRRAQLPAQQPGPPHSAHEPARQRPGALPAVPRSLHAWEDRCWGRPS